MADETVSFLGLQGRFSDFQKAAAVILPVPYEGGVSYGSGASGGPMAALRASHYLELYDEVLDQEPFRMGIATMKPPELQGGAMEAHDAIFSSARRLIEERKFVAVLGGDHSISGPFFRALNEKHEHLSVLQIDAHADLRTSYEGSPLSHACVMSRIREHTRSTLQVGIRSMSAEEAERVRQEELRLFTMNDFRSGSFNPEKALEELPDPVFITVDVDAFDWSVIRSTGTPEPGGFSWDEALELLRLVFMKKQVVAFDVVELSHCESEPNSAFAVAKLMYKMLGFKLESCVRSGRLQWPTDPSGPLLV